MPKKVMSGLIIIMILIIVIPGVIVRGCNWQVKESQQKVLQIKVKMKNGAVKKIPLEEYIIGVVAAEMPASFEIEAIKAQSIAARTYTLKRLVKFGGKINKEHPDADVCIDPAHCQAWDSQEEMRSKWGWLKFFEYYNKIKKAVNSTSNLVLVYDGKLIDPVYHSSCGNQTEDAGEVWKTSLPYLTSVSCQWEDENRYTKVETTYTTEKIARLLKMSPEEAVQFKIKPEIRATRYTVSGRVGGLIIGAKVVSGTELRTLFNLRSTFITWEIRGNEVRFITKGNGHGVGLCQYGSNGLAKNKKSFSEILRTYYQNVTIEKMKY